MYTDREQLSVTVFCYSEFAADVPVVAERMLSTEPAPKQL